ncbi:MAG: toxic anion resistance protein [Defluviitaleaceae bacterium]|nr:toxic anion resistance protein [Defluviitaleaceae bacterium]
MSDMPVLDLGIDMNVSEPPKYSLEICQKEADKPKDNALTMEALKPDEQKVVRDFMEKIDITNTSIVMQFGTGAQNKIAQFSDSVLQNVKSKDMGEVGRDLSNLVVEIKSFDGSFDEGASRGIRGFFRNIKKSAERTMASFSTVENNVDKIVSALEGHQRTLMKDVHMLEEMFKNNINYIRELTMYIIAGQEKLDDFRAVDIPAQRERAQNSNDEVEAQKLNDMINMAERFDKKLHDIKLSRIIAIQMAPQIRLVQNNDVSLIEQIQSSITNAIPLWKNQMVIALGMQNSRAAMAAQNKVTDMTNELLIKNSEMLKQGSVEIAEAAQRGIVSIDTIKKTNDNLIDTINSVLDIQQKGAANRRAAEGELAKIETDLKHALTDASVRASQAM